MSRAPIVCRLWIAVSVIVLSVGCGSREEEVSDKDRAVDYLNQQRYDDAAAVLEDLVEDSPGDGELRILLASAHAGAVGFNVIDAFEAFEPLLFAKNSAKGSAKLAEDVAPAGGARPFEKDLLRFIDQMVTQFRTITAVPFIPAAERSRLIEGISQLNAVEDGDAHYVRAVSYRAVLNALQFLNLLRDALPRGADDEALSFQSVMCGVDVQAFTGNLEVSTNYLLSSVEDVSKVYATRSRKMPASIERLRDTAIDVSNRYETNKNAITEAQLAFAAAKDTYCP